MTQLQTIDRIISDLRAADTEAKAVDEKREELRAQLKQYLERADLKTYKSDLATVSYVEKKNVTIADPARLLADIEQQNIVRYFEVVPEHKEFTKALTEDLKTGAFQHEAASVETQTSIQVKFVN